MQTTDGRVPRPRVDIYYKTPTSKAWGTSQKREHKDYKS